MHDESAPFWLDCPDPEFRTQVHACRDMEASVVQSGLEGLVLRYGFFYGAGTWYAPDGTMGKMLRKRMMPIIGKGEGLSSFIHIDDAVEATVAALSKGATGIYNITDPEPATWAAWTTETARLLGAKPPRHVPAWLGKLAAGTIATHYATTLRGASSARARAALEWSPRPWREGFAQVFAAR